MKGGEEGKASRFLEHSCSPIPNPRSLSAAGHTAPPVPMAQIGIATATATGQGSRGDDKKAADPIHSSEIRKKSTVTAATRMTHQPPEKKTAKAGGSRFPSWTVYVVRFVRLDPAIRRRLLVVTGKLALLALMPLLLPILLMVHYNGQHMAQVCVFSVTMSFFAFLFMICLYRPWGFFTDLIHLSYGLGLACVAADHVGRWAAIIVLHCNTVWAAGYVGYCLARHRLHVKGTVPAMDLLPNPSPFTTNELQQQIRSAPHIAISMSLLWIAFMAFMVKETETVLYEDLQVVLFISIMGWLLAAAWAVLISNGGVAISGVYLGGPTPSWAKLALCLFLSPLLGFLPMTLLHWLVLLDLVAYIGYYAAVYLHYLRTAVPRLKTSSNDTSEVADVSEKA